MNSAVTLLFLDDQHELIRCGTGGGDGIQYAFVGLEHIGHELAHGISGMECGWTSSSSMETQSLDEGVADAFGVMVDFEAVGSDANYLLGENNGLPAGSGRNMANPASKGMPDTYLGVNWSFSSDVEFAKYKNMGVINYWYYLLVEGGEGVNDNDFPYEVEGIGRYKAARILYRAMYAYLGASSQFADAKNATLYSAMDLYGACSFEVAQTIAAWNAVGVESSLGIGANIDVNCSSLLAAHNAGNEVTSRAIDVLRATCPINANNTGVSFFAGQAVELLPGFSSGDKFLAQIDPCFAQAKSITELQTTVVQAASTSANAEADRDSSFVAPLFGYSIWPNPSNGLVTVQLLGGTYEKNGSWTVEVTSTLGTSVTSQTVNGDIALLDLRSRSGVFLISLQQGNRRAVERVVIQN